MTDVRGERRGDVVIVTIDRPSVRNAIDAHTAAALAAAFRDFDADDTARVAVLAGAGGTFCAGYDLRTLRPAEATPFDESGDAPLGVSRMLLSKPVIAAVEGHAVAGGLELALWCDLRIASDSAVFGVFCRRLGVPLVDGGTVRLPRLVGQGRALEMILSGRPVLADEALRWGLVTEVVPAGAALDTAVQRAQQLAALPQTCLRSDRLSAYEQWSLPFDEALRNETRRGMDVLTSGEPFDGAARFRGDHTPQGGRSQITGQA